MDDMKGKFGRVIRRYKGIALTTIGVCLIVTIPCAFTYGTRDSVTATVKKTEAVVTGSGSSTKRIYLVFTDKETLCNKDSLMYLKFNSSDIYGEIQPGATYRFNVYGWRIPFLSMYRNIISADPCK